MSRPGRTASFFFLLSRADSALHQLFSSFSTFALPAGDKDAVITTRSGVLQIAELPVSEKDIEKEHLGQLRRWKEAHGDLHCKSPPRMHGAKAIMAAEPPSRQDLRQRPTIIVESPLAEPDRPENSAAGSHTGSGKVKSARTPLLQPVDPHLLSTDPGPPPSRDGPSGSKESLSSGEHDTYL